MNDSSTSRHSANSVWFGRALIVAAAILWSASGFFAKAPIFDNWPIEQRPFLLTFWRAIFASFFLVFFVRKITWSWRLIPMALAFAAMSLSYMSSIVYAEATLAIWLQYTAPIWVLLGGALIFREPAKRIDLVFLAIALSGVAWIVVSQLNGPTTLGLIFGLLSGLFFGLVVLFLRNLRDVDAAWLIFLNQATAAVVVAPFVFFQEQVLLPQNEQWLYLITFGVLQMGIPYVLFARGLRSVVSHEASGLLLLEPILVPVWVFVAWHHVTTYEAPHISTWIGAVLILVSLAIKYGYEVYRYRENSKLGKRSTD